MIVLAFGTYNSQHAANRLLIEDLRRAGAEVRICHQPLWEETRDKLAPYFSPRGLVWLGLRYLKAIARLLRRLPRALDGAGAVVAGFNGQLDVLVARLLCRRRRIIFAPLVTISETLIDDRRRYARGSLAGRFLTWLDRLSLAAADLVILDTVAHRDYVVERFGLPEERILVQYLGAEPIFKPAAPANARPAHARDRTRRSPCRLRVLWYSSYLPLHGSLVVARAVRLLGSDAGIDFELIGSGPERAASDQLVKDLTYVTLVDWVEYAELPERIAAADVVLGIFGSSRKARMVVPNKLYQAAQVGRAMVSADSPALREVFVPGESICAVLPEPDALARALVTLAGDPSLRERLARGGQAQVERLAGESARAARLARVLGLGEEPATNPAVGGVMTGSDRGETPLVAAVVVNYNGGAVTPRCIESVRASVGVRLRIIVVDNASLPEERALLEQAYSGVPEVELLLLPDNRHFAGGVNAGAERGIALGAEYFLFLNNDTELEQDCVRLLVAAARAAPRAGLVGPALLDLREPERALSLGERYSVWSICLPRTLLRVRSAGDGRPYRVGGIMGSVIMATRECFERVGRYREDLHVYYEEVDYCLRARELGFEPLLVPRAIARHDGMRGFLSGLQPYAAYLKSRNLLILMRDHGRALDWLGFLPSYLGLIAGSAAIYGARGHGAVLRAMLRGVADGVRALSQARVVAPPS